MKQQQHPLFRQLTLSGQFGAKLVSQFARNIHMISLTGGQFIFTYLNRIAKLILTHLLFTFFFFQSYSQTSITKFNWGPENEINFYTYPALPHKVQGFAQDKYGYMWIGSTDGLYRFDGVTYKRFVHDDADSSSIGSNNCHPFLVDSRGMLWASTSIGLSILNTSTYTFRNYCFSDTLFNDIISGVVEDGENNIWISSFGRKNLTKNEPSKNKFTVYSVPDSIYWKGMRTFDIASSVNGKIYLASDNGVMIFNPENGDYQRLVAKFPNHRDLLFYWGNQCIFIDNTGTLYSGNFNNPEGKLALGILNERIKRIEHEFEDVEVKYYNVFHITEKSDDELWIAANNGLLIYNKKTKQCKPCMHIADDPFSFPDELNSTTRSIFKDQSGCFWINSGNKIVKADPLDNFVKSYDLQKLFEVKHISGFNPTSVLKLAAENKIFIGSYFGAGFYKIDLNRNKLSKENIYTDLKQSYCEIQKLLMDAKGKLWAVTQHLILQYNSLAGKFIPCKVNSSFPQGSGGNFAFTSMIEDSRGHFWLGTYKHGVYDFNPEDNSYINYPKESYNSIFLKPDFMKPCFEDEQGNIWFVSFDGTYLFNLKNKTFTRISYRPGDLKYNDGRDLLKDRSGNIWRTTYYGGFQQYNPEMKIFEVVDANMDTRQIRLSDMVEDNRGYIWINSEEDVYRFEQLHNTFMIPKQSMHIEMGNSIIGFCKDDGTLYTAKGAMLYETNTNYFNGNTNVPAIVFNSFKVLNRDTAFSKNLNDISNITLPYDKNFISIEFAALNFSNSENNQYSYKLNGIDKEWVMNGNNNSVSYSNLAPGNYLFHVKASNNTGLWNDVGKSLSIIITPPWWQTWWARIVFGFVALVFVLVSARAYTQFKLRAQRNEIEKQKALDRQRSRISRDLHDDLGAGLTAISMLSEQLQNLSDPERIDKSAGKIKESSRELVDQMSEIVWSMNPKNDTLENLIGYVRGFALNYFDELPVKLSIIFPEIIPSVTLTGNERRNIFLVIKETLHNIAKHSEATVVNMEAEFADREVHITIADNGKGFNLEQIRRFGNGLKNMQSRMAEIKGSVSIKTSEGNGTHTVIRFPFVLI